MLVKIVCPEQFLAIDNRILISEWVQKTPLMSNFYASQPDASVKLGKQPHLSTKYWPQQHTETILLSEEFRKQRHPF